MTEVFVFDPQEDLWENPLIEWPTDFSERSADDDHFYGAWTTGGGRASASARQGATFAAPAQPKRFMGKVDAGLWGNDNFARWGKGLTNREEQALGMYAGGYYREINATLRGEEIDIRDRAKAEEKIPLIDAALKKATVPESVVVWRGAKGEALPEGLVGKTIRVPGYTSTSLTKDTARYFAAGHGPNVHYGEGPPVLAEITIPRGMHAAFVQARMENIDQIVGEMEMLIPRNTRFKVLSDTLTGGELAGMNDQFKFRFVRLQALLP